MKTSCFRPAGVSAAAAIALGVGELRRAPAVPHWKPACSDGANTHGTLVIAAWIVWVSRGSSSCHRHICASRARTGVSLSTEPLVDQSWSGTAHVITTQGFHLKK